MLGALETKKLGAFADCSAEIVLLDCYLGFCGDRIWNFDIRPTDGTKIYAYLGENGKFQIDLRVKLVEKDVKWIGGAGILTLIYGLRVHSVNHYTIKCLCLVFWIQSNITLQKIDKKIVPSGEAEDEALGWNIWTNLIFSILICRYFLQQMPNHLSRQMSLCIHIYLGEEHHNNLGSVI